MPNKFGLTANGLVIMRLPDIQAQINASLQAAFGPQINLVPPSVFGVLSGIFANREALLWELLLSVCNSQYPDTAAGAFLDNVAAISSIIRLAATFSTAKNVILFGTATDTIPAGSQFSVDGAPGSIFETTADVPLIAGTDEQQLISFSAVPTSGSWTLQFYNQQTIPLSYNLDQSFVEEALTDVIQLLIPSGSCNVTGDYTTGFTITYEFGAGKQPVPLIVVSANTLLATATPVTVTPSELVLGVAQGTATAVAIVTGPITAPAFSLTTIVTPVAGLTSVMNLTDALIGRKVESDAAFRIRRTASLGIPGAATVEAIRSKILNLAGIQSAFVIENSTNATVDGAPPKSIECIVRPSTATQLEIATTIWKSKPAGILTYGNTTVDIVDSQGFTHAIKYWTPTAVTLYAIINITRDLTGEVPGWPTNGVLLTQAALSAFVAGLGPNRDVVPYPQLMSVLIEIPGIYEATIFIGTAPAPGAQVPIPITPQQYADLETSNIVVNVT